MSKRPCPTSSSKPLEDRRKFILDPVKVAPWRALPPGYIETNGPCKGLDKLQESGTIIIPTKYKIKDPPPITPWKDVVEAKKVKFRQCQKKDKKEGRIMTPTKYRIKEPPPIVSWKDVVESKKEKLRQCKGKDKDITKDGRVMTPTKYRKRCAPKTDTLVIKCDCSAQKTPLIAPWRFLPPGYTTKNCRVIFSEQSKSNEQDKTKTAKRSPK